MLRRRTPALTHRVRPLPSALPALAVLGIGLDRWVVEHTVGALVRPDAFRAVAVRELGVEEPEAALQPPAGFLEG